MREDQATGLRRLFAPRAPSTFGVVGAAATPLAIDLARALARAGQRVLVLDRTHGEIGAALSLRARHELRHVLRGECALRQVVHNTPDAFDLLPAARGLDDVDGNDPRSIAVWAKLSAALTVYDVVLCNGAPWTAAAGAGWVLALAPTSASVQGAYTELKRLARTQGVRRCRVVVEHAPTERAALDAFASVADTAERFLGIRIELGGAIVASAPGTAGSDQRWAPRVSALKRFADALIADAGTASLAPA